MPALDLVRCPAGNWRKKGQGAPVLEPCKGNGYAVDRKINYTMDLLDIDSVVQFLVRLAPHASVVDHVRGQVRLKLQFSALSVLLDNNLDAIAQSVPGIRSLMIQALSRRVIIEYDPEVLPYDLWEDLARLKDQPGFASEISGRLEALASASE